MADEDHNESSWSNAAKGLDRTARRYLFGIRAVQTFLLLVVLAFAVTYWVYLDNPDVSIYLVFLGLSATTIRNAALGRWRSFLAQPWVEERVGNILILGPDYIKEIYQYTHGMLRFTLGPPPNNILKAAGFICQHLRWFLNPNPVEYKQALCIVFAFSLLVFFTLALVLIELAGYKQVVKNYAGGSFPALAVSILFCFGFYFIYLLERQVIALKRVARIIRELASSD